MLEHRHRALEIGATQEHFTEQREALTARAVDLDHAKQLALRLFPLMERRVRAREHHAPFEAVRRGVDADVADRDRVLGATEREVRLSQVDERRRRRIAANEIDELLDFLSRGPAIVHHQRRPQPTPPRRVAANATPTSPTPVIVPGTCREPRTVGPGTCRWRGTPAHRSRSRVAHRGCTRAARGRRSRGAARRSPRPRRSRTRSPHSRGTRHDRQRPLVRALEPVLE